MAGNGGGIFNTETLTITNSVITGNNASSDGGGVFNQYSGVLEVVGSELSSNFAGDDGGGISNDGQASK